MQTILNQNLLFLLYVNDSEQFSSIFRRETLALPFLLTSNE